LHVVFSQTRNLTVIAFTDANTYTRHQWRKAKLKSDGCGSKGLTPYTCLCYRCCALEEGT